MSVNSLTDEQALYAMQQVGRWLEIKERERQDTRSPDAMHSSLLHWLLTGHEPLPKPPPVIFSRPHHQLGSGQPISLNDPPIKMPDGENVLIASNAEWIWMDAEQGLLKHIPSDQLYRYDKKDRTLRKVEVQVV